MVSDKEQHRIVPLGKLFNLASFPILTYSLSSTVTMQSTEIMVLNMKGHNLHVDIKIYELHAVISQR